MKWVRCVYNGGVSGDSVLTVGKIYEVLNQILPNNYRTVMIVTDNGEKCSYLMITMQGVWFEEVTLTEIRDMKLNKILEDERYTIEVSE
jgi:deoxyxylulose-5-phosphate synthase